MSDPSKSVRDNIVMVFDGDKKFCGTAWFIDAEYCVTCHHVISTIGSIQIGRKDQIYHAEWVEKYSDMTKDIAFLRVKQSYFEPLAFKNRTHASIKVHVCGFDQGSYKILPANVLEGKLKSFKQEYGLQLIDIAYADNDEPQYHNTRGSNYNKKWNKKPPLDVNIYKYQPEGRAPPGQGYSGGPVLSITDWEVVGMYAAYEESTGEGIIIPIETIVEKYLVRRTRGIPRKAFEYLKAGKYFAAVTVLIAAPTKGKVEKVTGIKGVPSRMYRKAKEVAEVKVNTVRKDIATEKTKASEAEAVPISLSSEDILRDEEAINPNEKLALEFIQNGIKCRAVKDMGLLKIEKKPYYSHLFPMTPMGGTNRGCIIIGGRNIDFVHIIQRI